jgi:hypothetical protein
VLQIHRRRKTLEILNSAVGSTIEREKVELNVTEREVIANMLLHSADISNQCKSWPVAKRWSDCIMIEMFHQGDIESEQNLSLSPNSDRHTTDRVQFSLNFIDFVVAPLYVALTQLLPPLKEACSLLRANRLRWDAILQQNLSQANMSMDKRQEEDWRWKRRMESFDQILMTESTSKRISKGGRRSSLRVRPITWCCLYLGMEHLDLTSPIPAVGDVREGKFRAINVPSKPLP